MSLRYFVMACVLSLSATASAAEWHKGENLITPFVPASSEWDAYQRPKKDLKSLLWKLKSDENDQYAVTIINDYEKKLSDFRTMHDSAGERHCASHPSTTIEETPVNGYERMIWRTLCVRANGTKASILHLVIQGNDSFYHIMKMWKFDVADSDVGVWVARFKENMVCDTRKKKGHPCPEGFTRVE